MLKCILIFSPWMKSSIMRPVRASYKCERHGSAGGHLRAHSAIHSTLVRYWIHDGTNSATLRTYCILIMFGGIRQVGAEVPQNATGGI